MRRFALAVGFGVALLGGPGIASAAGTPTSTSTTTVATVATVATTATPTTAVANTDPTPGESWAAAVAVVGAIVVGIGIIVLVHRAHEIQRMLALESGQPVSVVTAPAAGGEQFVAPVGTMTITGPQQLSVGTAGEYTVADAADAVWQVTGIEAYTRGKKEPHTFVFTPHEVKPDVTVRVTSAANNASGELPVHIAAAPPVPSFVFQLVLRNWGLVLVAIIIVFGAIALGLTGHLDGANFIAIVAPLAALLGVTAAGSSGGGPGSGGGTAGGSAASGGGGQ